MGSFIEIQEDTKGNLVDFYQVVRSLQGKKILDIRLIKGYSIDNSQCGEGRDDG